MPDVALLGRGGKWHNIVEDPASIQPTSSATANTKGPWEELDPSLDYDATALAVSVRAGHGTQIPALADIGVGASGSEVVIIPNLHINTRAQAAWFAGDLPIAVPKGSRLACRTQDSDAVANVLPITVHARAGRPATPPLARCAALGANTGTSRGTTVDSGGTANVDSSWTQLGQLPFHGRALMLEIGHPGATFAAQTNYVDLGVYSGAAAGASTIEIVPDIMVRANAGGTITPFCIPPFDISIPAGYYLYVRHKSSTTVAAGARTLDYVAHVFG